MKEEEVQAYIIEICQKVVLNLAEMHKAENDKLNIRIDLQDANSKPVFGIFKESAFITRCSMTEIINAGGGKGLGMVLGTYVRNIIRDIFLASMKQLEIESTRQMFVLLFLKSEAGESIPMISVYKGASFQQSLPVRDFIGVKQ